MDISFLRLPAVIKKSGLSRATIYQQIKDGAFPPQVSIGPRAVAWTEASLNEWAEQRITESQRIDLID